MERQGEVRRFIESVVDKVLEAFAIEDTAGPAAEELVDQLAALERLKSAAAARQARLAVALDTRTREAEAARGVPAVRRGRGVAGQVALARRESPFRGRQHLGLAKVLTSSTAWPSSPP
jgi:hypothetical protein